MTCDSLEFLLWRHVICWATFENFHAFVKCSVNRYLPKVGTTRWEISETWILRESQTHFPDKEIAVKLLTGWQLLALISAKFLTSFFGDW